MATLFLKELVRDSGQDRAVGTEHKNLPRVRAPAGDAAQHANIRLRVLRPCRTPRRERGITIFWRRGAVSGRERQVRPPTGGKTR